MYYLTGKRYKIWGGKFLTNPYFGYNRPGGVQKLEFLCDTGKYWANEVIYGQERWWFLCDDAYRFFYVPDIDVQYNEYIGEHNAQTISYKTGNSYTRNTSNEPNYFNEANNIKFPGYRDEKGNKNEYTYMYPVGITFHNTGDYYIPGVVMNSQTYAQRYKSVFNSIGSSNDQPIAHYYVDGESITQMIDGNMSSWANGCPLVNQKYYSIEICDSWHSPSTSEIQFKLAEENAFWLAAKIIRSKNLDINSIYLHLENSSSCGFSTECPKRSQYVHGGFNNTKQYFKKRTKYYYDNPSALPNVNGNTGEITSEGFTGYSYTISGGRFVGSNYFGYDRPGGVQKLEFICDSGWYWAEEIYYNDQRWWGLCDDVYRFFYVPDTDVKYNKYMRSHIYK